MSEQTIDVLSHWARKPTDLQWEAIAWEPPPGTQEALTGALSPSFGTMKTSTAIMRAVRFMMSANCDWDPAYGEEYPIFLAVAPTSSLIRQVLIPMFRSYMPPQFVLSKRQSPPVEWVLMNGCRLVFMPATAEIDSITACGLFIDEVHKHYYEPDSTWSRITDRVRDSTVPGRWREIIVSGISHSTEVLRRRFDRPDDPTCHISFPGLNHSKIDEASKEKIRSGLPASMRDIADEGGWRPEVYESVFAEELDLRVGESLTDFEIDYDAPCVWTLDVGEQSALLVCQEHYRPGTLDVVDEYIMDNASERDFMRFMVDNTPWARNLREIHVDSTRPPNSVTLIRDVFPSQEEVPIKTIPRGKAAFLRTEKFQNLGRCLKDSNGVRRVRFHETLQNDNPRGIIRGLSTARRRTGHEDLVKDNDTDHAIDALAQLLMDRFPKLEPSAGEWITFGGTR